jgi:hypothetical protein
MGREFMNTHEVKAPKINNKFKFALLLSLILIIAYSLSCQRQKSVWQDTVEEEKGI